VMYSKGEGEGSFPFAADCICMYSLHLFTFASCNLLIVQITLRNLIAAFKYHTNLMY